MNAISIDDKEPTGKDALDIEKGNCLKCRTKYDPAISVIFVGGDDWFRWWHARVYVGQNKYINTCPC